jgi:hypothetical protein
MTFQERLQRAVKRGVLNVDYASLLESMDVKFDDLTLGADSNAGSLVIYPSTALTAVTYINTITQASVGQATGTIWQDPGAATCYPIVGGAGTHMPITCYVELGEAASAAGSGLPLSATRTRALGVYADDGGAAVGSGVFMRAGRFRTLLTYTDGNREQEAAGVVGQINSVGGTNRHNMCGVMGSYELSGTSALVVDGQIWTTDPWIQAAVIGRVGVGSSKTTINTYGVLAGLAAMSNTAAFTANNGYYTGIYVGKWSGNLDWAYGMIIDGGAVTTGIYISGGATTAIETGSDTAGMDNKFFGTTTGAYMLWDTSEDELALVKSTISCSGALDGTEHVIHITNTGLGDMKAFYAGAWGTELEFNDGGGLFRIYGKVGAGGTASANMFIRTLTESTSSPIGVQFYTDTDAASGGPAVMAGCEAYCMVNTNKYLGESSSYMEGMWGFRSKVGSNFPSTVSGNVYGMWINNVMNSTVGGDHYGILFSNEGNNPDAVFAFEALAGKGYNTLFKFCTSMVGDVPLSSEKVDATDNSAGTILIDIGGTTYYIPYYDSGDLV